MQQALGIGAAAVKAVNLQGEAKCTVCAFLVKARSGGYQMWIPNVDMRVGTSNEERFAQQESGAASKCGMYVSGQLLYEVCIN